MRDNFCHRCGRFMSYRKRISYRLPTPTTPRATAESGVCSCGVPILNGPPPGYASLSASQWQTLVVDDTTLRE
jgi:hypothetical protein